MALYKEYKVAYIEVCENTVLHFEFRRVFVL